MNRGADRKKAMKHGSNAGEAAGGNVVFQIEKIARKRIQQARRKESIPGPQASSSTFMQPFF